MKVTFSSAKIKPNLLLLFELNLTSFRIVIFRNWRYVVWLLDFLVFHLFRSLINGKSSRGLAINSVSYADFCHMISIVFWSGIIKEIMDYNTTTFLKLLKLTYFSNYLLLVGNDIHILFNVELKGVAHFLI